MIMDTNTSLLDKRWIPQHDRFCFKKFIYDISGYIGLTELKFKITINQMHLLLFVTIWNTTLN